MKKEDATTMKKSVSIKDVHKPMNLKLFIEDNNVEHHSSVSPATLLKAQAAFKSPLRQSSRHLTMEKVEEETIPMSRREKLKKRIISMFSLESSHGSKTKQDAETGDFASKGYYRLNSELNIKNSNVVIKYLNWCFKTSFTKYFLSALLIYTFGLFLFALLFVALAPIKSGDEQNLCISNYPDEAFVENLFVSYILSWTTFSTVGYGNTYPEVQSACTSMNFVASTEAFLGVLYAGFCGAILFGKVQTVYSRAMVVFSAVCVIRYGDDIAEGTDDDEYEVTSGLHEFVKKMSNFSSDNTGILQSLSMNENPTRGLPHPVLIFRIVNQRANQPCGGGIMNLMLNAVGVIESRKQNRCDREQSTKVVARRQFHRMKIEPSTVPLFERILYVRHVLDKDSPLLNPETRKMIKKNNGKWPPSIDSSEAIRECLEFTQIIISLEGISDVSRSTVYYQKTYSDQEVKIGWRFVEMTYGEGILEYKVDFDLVNVVTEQLGGGGELLCDEFES